VEVEHGDEVALYAGLDKIRVTEGELVQAGQVLASIAAHPVGRERALGPHLHLEIRSKRAGVPVDPAPYLNLQGKGT
jgi:murein DD-endopeptidase MepM/ murein hydrolase activator NlpD